MNEQLLADAKLDRDYLALLIVAALVAACGLEQNSTATIIGAMVVAPLMLPIRALGFGLLRLESAMIVPAATTIVVSVSLAVGIGAAVGLIARRPEFGSEILSRTSVTFLGLSVALAGGTLAGLSRALSHSKITDALIGVGISVSLVPPLCTVGIVLANGNWSEGFGAFTIFLTNLVGISLACAIVFWLTGNAHSQRWRTVGAFAIYALAVLAISPLLERAAYRARQLSAVEYFIEHHGNEYLPSLFAVESTTISWEGQPYEIITTVRSKDTPTKDQVRRLNDAINRQLPDKYRLSLVVDPAITVVP